MITALRVALLRAHALLRAVVSRRVLASDRAIDRTGSGNPTLPEVFSNDCRFVRRSADLRRTSFRADLLRGGRDIPAWTVVQAANRFPETLRLLGCMTSYPADDGADVLLALDRRCNRLPELLLLGKFLLLYAMYLGFPLGLLSLVPQQIMRVGHPLCVS